MNPIASQKLKETAIKDYSDLSTEEKVKTPLDARKPTPAFIGASWLAVLTGMVSYCIGLWNAEMALNEKGYYFTILLFGLFSVISVQKSVRDRLEGLPVTDMYYGISWFATIAAVLLLIVGLWNADLLLSEKGFYGIAFTLSLFSAIAVQKNTRDLQLFSEKND
ncbi:inner membrane protein YiaA [Ascidiimonas sp. W6]|uniref:inner membrane protein YiaA n=1 Tax=Ascidiimonas meishanensis TaxID=3128903 RepID=UPI0030ECE441